jgi:Type IV secretion system pilin
MFTFVSQAHAAITAASNTTGSTATTFASVIAPFVANIVSPLIELMFAVAIVLFVWGIVQMLMHGDDATARQTGQNHMIAGLVGIFVMVSAWGIIHFISNTI